MLTLLPRRRGQYRLRLNLHAASMSLLPRGPGSHRSLSASSACSSPGATPPSASRFPSESPLKHDGSRTGSLTASPANSPSPQGAGMLLPRHGKSAGSAVRSSLGAVRLSSDNADGKGSGSPRDASIAEALDAIRALRGVKPLTTSSSSGCGAAAAAAAVVAAGSREDDMVAQGDAGGRGCRSFDASIVQPVLALDRPPLATAPVTADASFPSLLFTDVFCEGLPKQVGTAWRCNGPHGAAIGNLRAADCVVSSTSAVL